MAEKIAAVATGHARTGIGILRLSGDGCIEAAGQVFQLQSGKPLSSLPDRKLALGTLFDVQGRPIDHCMAFISRARILTPARIPPRSSATARPPRWPRGSRRCSPPGSGRRGRANLHAVRF